MAKKIALELEIGGVKKSVSSISELETAIKEANDELKKLDIGSAGFNKLQGEIKKAKDLSEDLQESLKGQDLEKRVGAYAKVGSAIVSSFAAANAAIALFGEENEEVAKAAAKAQSVLTIALTAREVAEGAVAIKTVAANIATTASAAAAGAATTATRALYATLAANPYGVILAVIGAVVAALIVFTDESEKQVDIQNELAKATSEEANALSNSLIILTQFNGQRDLQNREIEKLKKEYPGFNAFIDKENKLNQQGVKFIQLKIKQYELEAQAKLVTQKIAENSIKILEIESKSILDNVSFWESAWNVIKTGGQINASITEDFKTGIENQRKEIESITNENERWRKSLSDIYLQTDDVLKQIKPFEQTLEVQVQTEKDLVNTQDKKKKLQQDINSANEKGFKSTIDLAGAVKKLDESFKNYNQTLDRISKIEYDAPIIEQLKKIEQARREAAKALLTDVQNINQSLNEVAAGAIPEDQLIKIFQDLRGRLENEFTLISGGLPGNFAAIYEEFIANNDKLSIDQKKLLSDLVDAYKDVSKFVINTPGFVPYIKNLKDVNVAWDDFTEKGKMAYKEGDALLQIIGDISAASGEFRLEFGKDFQITPINFDPKTVKTNAQAYIQQLQVSLFRPIGEALIKEQIDLENKLLSITTDAVAKAEIEGRLKSLKIQLEEFKKTGQITGETTKVTTQVINEQVVKTTDNFIKFVTTITAAEQKFLVVNQEVDKLTKTLAGNEKGLSQAIGGVVTQNIDKILNVIFKARTEEGKLEERFTKQYQSSEVERANFKNLLLQQGVNVEKASYEDLLQAYIAYKKKEGEVTEKSEQDKREKFNKTLDDIGKGIQLFQTSLNELSSVASERIQADLEMLKVAEQKALQQVVGDSETAAEKRLEIQAEYEARRKELEKKGRVTALQFSLVQSIANAAQAITALWTNPFVAANPILGAIQTALIAGVTAAQIGIIQDQIQTAQALRKGGLVKAQGGMLLSGPTHEQGGIPLAQMGVIAEGQEAIINRNSLINYRDLLSTVNQAGGGRPLVVNSFDDTRIVEAIAQQKQKPLRAYVLQSEITNEQALSKRLDDLSKI